MGEGVESRELCFGSDKFEVTVRPPNRGESEAVGYKIWSSGKSRELEI